MNKHNEIGAGFRWRAADRATKRGNWLRDLVIALAVALAASILGMIGEAYAAESRTIQIAGNDRTVMLTVPIGKSEDVRTDTAFVDLIVGDPEVADVNPLTDHALSILGKKIGTTRVSVYAEGKKLIGIFDVEVSYDITRLTNELRRRFPGSRIKASTVNGRIMLSGEVMDAATLDKAVTIARQFGPEIINSVSVMSPQQVMLEVRFIEISRTAGRELGVQWNLVGNKSILNVGNRVSANNLPISPTSIATDAAAGVISGASPFGFLIARLVAGGVKTDVLINALEEKGIARSLAEPNLVALSGDTASFLAGGEYPIPVSGSFGQVTRRLQEIRRRSCLHADRARPRPDQPEDRAGSQPDRHDPYGLGQQRRRRAGVDRASRFDHRRTARWPELRDRRLAAERQQERDRAAAMAWQHAGSGRVVLQQVLSEERNRPRHHCHAAPRASGAARG